MKRGFSLIVVIALALLGAQAFAYDPPDIRSNLTEHSFRPQITDPKELLKQAPAFDVEPRTDKLMLYPCSNCHAWQTPTKEVRDLTMMHGELPLDHGRGQFWCTQCHDLENRDMLTSLKGEEIDFNDAYLLCGQCHQARFKDFLKGGHGKNLAGWQGKKKLANCTKCHNPHVPKIRPLEAKSGPEPRHGIQYETHKSETKHEKFWPSDFSNYGKEH